MKKPKQNIILRMSDVVSTRPTAPFSSSQKLQNTQQGSNQSFQRIAHPHRPASKVTGVYDVIRTPVRPSNSSLVGHVEIPRVAAPPVAENTALLRQMQASKRVSESIPQEYGIRRSVLQQSLQKNIVELGRVRQSGSVPYFPKSQYTTQRAVPRPVTSTAPVISRPVISTAPVAVQSVVPVVSRPVTSATPVALQSVISTAPAVSRPVARTESRMPEERITQTSLNAKPKVSPEMKQFEDNLADEISQFVQRVAEPEQEIVSVIPKQDSSRSISSGVIQSKLSLQSIFASRSQKSAKAQKKLQRKRLPSKIHPARSARTFKSSFSEVMQSFWQSVGNAMPKKLSYAMSIVLCVGLCGYGVFHTVNSGLKLKGEVLGVTQEGYSSMNAATDALKEKQFDVSATNFAQAVESFEHASQSFDDWNTTLVDASRFFPLISKLSSGKNAVEAGEHIARAGSEINEALRIMSSVKNPLDTSKNVSLLVIFQSLNDRVTVTRNELQLAQKSLDKVKIDDLPEDKRDKFLQVKTGLPVIVGMLQNFSDSHQVMTDLLGGNGPRKYLFLFQNNHEMRATGGFIGSYGLIDVSNGHIRNFFVDGIFNPDGQLRQNIVPPKPIQKMSAAWSLHDSNWFPDFPLSAEKAISFYEKTGGPTVDGVITLTPAVMQKLLRVTGPIHMEDYDKTLNAENFVAEVQQEVEVDYDKKENKPKQILADLAPILLDKLFNVSSAHDAMATIQAFEEGLGEKHILLYSRNQDIEKIISDAGWSGEVLAAQKDYISVINTNINGYKTDGVIQESIEHTASIQDNGSIINTVRITRKHTGGNTEKDWWNRVNADYMRVYVPKGSKLLSVQGQTREVVESPLDYDALGFKRDLDIDHQENSVTIDPESGTQMYEESGKTVFANWVYVSPQESVTIEYTYELPFTLRLDDPEKEGYDSYSLIAQKQSGSMGSAFQSEIHFPSSYKVIWQSDENLIPYDGGMRYKDALNRDAFLGVLFEKY